MYTLADSPLIPASILFSMPTAHPPTQGSGSFLLCLTGYVWYMAYGFACFSLRICPCPNRAFGKAEAYLLFVFSLSLFLVFGSCYPYLQDISDAWWRQVSCCGRSLLVHSSGVTLRPSRHGTLCRLFWYAALMLFLCLRGLHGFPCCVFSMRL